ncbi:isocitrate lyase/PEP mutase family protein [Nonomuraea sp. SBT364]|uniref:isocitrate lyase/PEP mutase family protein n=1 Tax=Nonomuraea sp. SBT364 TaxID=1580530 RepID=UPI00066C6681|nr:isocitrate lyase/phosphoenolpyruvate mutase family protein [Nonomuraea sp. SBT364]
MPVDSSTSSEAVIEKQARLFRTMSSESVLVLPNAWDAASAAVIAAAGATAIATTSGGVAWSLGHGDGQRLSRGEMAEAARRIVDSVDLPVTVDIEGGYGPARADVAATVRAVVEAGAVGVNLEDSTAVGGPLFEAAEQSARLSAARNAATEASLPELFVNARTDVFLFAIGAPGDRLGEVLARAEAYAEAGADGLFVPGLLDLDVLHSLCAASPLPVNAMAVAGGPSVGDLAQAGVRRISLGTGLAQAAYAAVSRAAAEVLGTGGLTALDGSLEFGELNTLFHH